MPTNDFARVSDLLADRYVLRLSQSKEAVHGRENFTRFHREYPAHGHWRFTVRRLVAEGSIVSDVDVTDGVVTAKVISFSTVEAGLITQQLEFWPEPYDAPEWRRAWTRSV